MYGRERTYCKPIFVTGAAASNVEFAAELAKRRAEVNNASAASASASASAIQTTRTVRQIGGVQFVPGSCRTRKRGAADDPLLCLDDDAATAAAATERRDDEREGDGGGEDEAARLRASRVGLLAKAALYDAMRTAAGPQFADDDAASEAAPLVDFARQRQLQRWQELDRRNAESDVVHYASVDYDEARQHGVGHYRFSVDAAERADQLAALNRRTEETEAGKRRRLEALAKRKAASAARLERVRQRRGIVCPAEDSTESEAPAEPEPGPASAPASASAAHPSAATSSPSAEEVERRIRAIRQAMEARSSATPAWERATRSERQERNPEFAPPYAK